MPDQDLDRISLDLVIHKTWLQVISRSGANGNRQKHRFKKKGICSAKKIWCKVKAMINFHRIQWKKFIRRKLPKDRYHVKLSYNFNTIRSSFEFFQARGIKYLGRFSGAQCPDSNTSPLPFLSHIRFSSASDQKTIMRSIIETQLLQM